MVKKKLVHTRVVKHPVLDREAQFSSDLPGVFFSLMQLYLKCPVSSGAENFGIFERQIQEKVLKNFKMCIKITYYKNNVKYNFIKMLWL